MGFRDSLAIYSRETLWLGSDFRAATEADDSMRDFLLLGKAEDRQR
jgi:hypothetical protein